MMTNPQFAQALAEERRQNLLDDASRASRARFVRKSPFRRFWSRTRSQSAAGRGVRL